MQMNRIVSKSPTTGRMEVYIMGMERKQGGKNPSMDKLGAMVIHGLFRYRSCLGKKDMKDSIGLEMF
jgi:hypothetical protein